jgi:hypothetical protein
MKKLNFHTDLCPCGSGLPMSKCCLTLRTNTTPPPPVTEHSNPRCYAKTLSDCDSKISREHYVSEGILSLKNGALTVLGFPWQPNGNLKKVSAQALTAKVLCKRHNTALSGLDSVAIKFFKFLIGDNHNQNVLLINGNEIERWMLKMLCGLAASGNIAFNSQRSHSWTPPNQWLQILFGNANIPSNCGLYYVSGNYRFRNNKMELVPVQNNNSSELVSIALTIDGFPFLFSMEPPPPLARPVSGNAELNHRPECIGIEDGTSYREVHLGWPSGKFIKVNIKG